MCTTSQCTTENYFGVFSAEQFCRRFCRNCSVKNLRFLTEQNHLQNQPVSAEPASFGRNVMISAEIVASFSPISYIQTFSIYEVGENEVTFYAEPATFRPKLPLFCQNWPVRQKLAGSADGLVRLRWFGGFEVQNFCFCRNWKTRFGRTLDYVVNFLRVTPDCIGYRKATVFQSKVTTYNQIFEQFPTQKLY